MLPSGVPDGALGYSLKQRPSLTAISAHKIMRSRFSRFGFTLSHLLADLVKSFLANFAALSRRFAALSRSLSDFDFTFTIILYPLVIGCNYKISHNAASSNIMGRFYVTQSGPCKSRLKSQK
jgi:hypothetical protein